MKWNQKQPYTAIKSATANVLKDYTGVYKQYSCIQTVIFRSKCNEKGDKIKGIYI
ncbi:MAG: hypothetical protein Q8880_05085 [Bacteroidota bacterium]|nr:hypothetical protein [Bacteroidota bacterium]